MSGETILAFGLAVLLAGVGVMVAKTDGGSGVCSRACQSGGHAMVSYSPADGCRCDGAERDGGR